MRATLKHKPAPPLPTTGISGSDTDTWATLTLDMLKDTTGEQMRVVHVYPIDDNHPHHSGVRDNDDDAMIGSSCECDPDHEVVNGALLVTHQRILHH